MSLSAKILFHNSTSRALDRVLRLAGKFKSFRRSERDGQNELQADADDLRVRWKEFAAIWEQVRNWRGSSLWLDDREAMPEEIRERTKVLECSEQYRLAVLQEVHCYPH